MTAINVGRIVDNAALEIGTDASFFRVKRERLHLSGIEIATAAAVGLIASYLAGLYRGAKKRLGERGEQDGVKLVDALLEKLRLIRSRVIQLRDEEDDAKTIDALKNSLDESTDPDWLRIALEESESPEDEISLISEYLGEIGYPSDIIQDRVDRLVPFLRKEVARLRG